MTKATYKRKYLNGGLLTVPKDECLFIVTGNMVVTGIHGTGELKCHPQVGGREREKETGPVMGS